MNFWEQLVCDLGVMDSNTHALQGSFPNKHVFVSICFAQAAHWIHGLPPSSSYPISLLSAGFKPELVCIFSIIPSLSSLKQALTVFFFLPGQIPSSTVVT